MDPSSLHDHPERIGPYRILRVLGAGGMGIVYEAEQLEPVRRRVALKVIKLGMDTREVVARFEAERQALAVMHHPGIAAVLDGGATAEGRPYFVMELVHGIPFTEYCDSHQLSLRDRITLFIGVAQAVQHAHQKGVIHRDLKPSNILVTEHDGVPAAKIIDFGIAKAISQPLTDKTLVTAYGMALGTLAYMSPEQAEMSNLDIDTRSDIYSLGVMLFEVLVGELPVDPSAMGAVPFLAQLVGRVSEPARPSTRMTTTDRARRQAQLRNAESGQLRKQLRGDLDWIVVKAMEKDRNRRYDTANALALDLERYLRNEPVLARSPTALYRFRKFARRNAVAVAAGAGITLALILGVVMATVGLVRATRAEALAEQQGATAQEVSDFLVELMRVGDPSAAGGRQVTIRERDWLAGELAGVGRVIVAGDGAAALAAAQGSLPDLIVSDVRMGGMDGFELCRRIRADERTSHVPVILLSVGSSVDRRVEGSEAGADAFLAKPVDGRELRAQSTALLERRRALRERFREQVIVRPAEVSDRPVDQLFFEKVVATIEEHLDAADFSVGELATEMAMSVSQLSRKLSALIDQTPGQLMRGMRLERAAALVAGNAASLAEIAYRVGFSDQAHFSRSFKRHFGMTPSEYREARPSAS